MTYRHRSLQDVGWFAFFVHGQRDQRREDVRFVYYICVCVCVFVCHTVWLCEQSRKNVTECAVLQLLLRLFG